MMIKSAGVNKFSLRQTINQITFDFNPVGDSSRESDAEDVTWSEVIRRCIDQRREQVWSKFVKDVTVSDSEVSSADQPEEQNLFSQEPSQEGAENLQAFDEYAEIDGERNLLDIAQGEVHKEENGASMDHEEDLSDEEPTLTPENVNNAPESDAEGQEREDILVNDGSHRSGQEGKHGSINETQSCAAESDTDEQEDDINKDDENCAETVRDEACAMSYNLIVEPQICEPLEKSPITSLQKIICPKEALTTLIEKVPDTPGMFNLRRFSQGKRNSSRKISSTPKTKESPRRSLRSNLNSTTELPQKTLSPATSRRGSRLGLNSPKEISEEALSSSTTHRRSRTSSNSSKALSEKTRSSAASRLNSPDLKSSKKIPKKSLPSTTPPSNPPSTTKSQTTPSSATITDLHYNSFDSIMSAADAPFSSPTPSEKSLAHDSPFTDSGKNNSMGSRRSSQKTSEGFTDVNRQLSFSSENGNVEQDHEEELEKRPSKASSGEKALDKKTNRRHDLQSAAATETNASKRPARFLSGRRVEWWRNERPIYVMQAIEDDVPVMVCKGISKASSPDILKRKMPLKANNQKRQKKILEESKVELCDLSETFVQKSQIARIKMKDLIKPFAEAVFKPFKNSDTAYIAVSHKDKENGSAVGFLKFDVSGQKPPVKTGNYKTCLTVIKGAIAITIGEASLDEEPSIILKKFETVIVPPRNSYEIKNINKSESVVHFSLMVTDY